MLTSVLTRWGRLRPGRAGWLGVLAAGLMAGAALAQVPAGPTRPVASVAAPAAQARAASAVPAAPATTASAHAPSSAPAPAARAASTSTQAMKPTPVFVLNSLDGNVSVIDPTTWKEIKRIPTGKEPHHLYLTPDEKSVIVANAASDSLTFIDPRTAEVQRTVRGILDPYHLRFSPDMKWFLTNGNRLNHVDVYRWDGSNLQLAKRIATGKTPSHLWIDSKSTIAYSSMQDSDELVVIDLATQTILHRIKVGSLPADIYVTPDDRTLFLGLTGGEGVEVYDVSGVRTGQAPRFLKLLPTGKGAHAFRPMGDGEHIFVSNRVANTISRIDTRTQSVDFTMPTSAGPDCMDLSADGKTLLVSSRWARKLTLIDLATRKIVREIPVGASPHGVWTLDHAPRR